MEQHFLTPNPNQEEVEDWRVTDFQGDLTRKAGQRMVGGSDEPEFVASTENGYMTNRKTQPFEDVSPIN